MERKPVKLLTRFTPPSTTGPHIAVARADVVAIEASHFDPDAQLFRSLIHLRGGSTLLVDDPFEFLHPWLGDSE